MALVSGARARCGSLWMRWVIWWTGNRRGPVGRWVDSDPVWGTWGDGWIGAPVFLGAASWGRPPGAMALGLGEEGDGCGYNQCHHEVKRTCPDDLKQTTSLKVSRERGQHRKTSALEALARQTNDQQR
jgi:hypothetical protein